MTPPATVVVLSMLGAVVGLDFVSFPQAMLSRPLVAATLGGFVCGNPIAGLLVGVMLECFALETMPFGASRYPEWGPASVAAGAMAAVPSGNPEDVARALPFAMLAGLVCGMVGGMTLVWLRRFNLTVAQRYREELAAGDAAAVVAVHWIGLVIDFGRAGAITALFALTLLPARDLMLGAVASMSAPVSLAVTSVLAIGVGGAAVWKVVHTTKGYAWYLLGGLLVGVALTMML